MGIRDGIKDIFKNKTASGGSDVVYVCVEDCWHNKTRFRRGDILTDAQTGGECPPHFEVKEDAEEGEEE